MQLGVYLMLLLPLLADITAAWSVGDVVPLSVSFRFNGSNTATAFEPIDNTYNPRFAVSRSVEVASLDFSRGYPYVSLQFLLERGLNRRTKWIVLKRMSNVSATMDAAGGLGAEVDHMEQSQQHLRDVFGMGSSGATSTGKKEVHLAQLRFEFGFQSGLIHRFTSFKVTPLFSSQPQVSILLRYEWHEHRSFNPRRALLCVTLLVFGGLVLVVHHVVSQALGDSKGRFRGMIVVHERKE